MEWVLGGAARHIAMCRQQGDTTTDAAGNEWFFFTETVEENSIVRCKCNMLIDIRTQFNVKNMNG